MFNAVLGDTAKMLVASGTLPTQFEPDVKGRVTPVGTFDDIEGTLEVRAATSYMNAHQKKERREGKKTSTDRADR